MWPIHKKEAKSTQTNLKITQILELEVKDFFIFFYGGWYTEVH